MTRRFMSLTDWLDWQTRLHPSVMAFGLERVAAVWSRLGPGALPCPVVTVGGTNGKGSGVALLEAMARAGGYRTLAYTSPHLLRYNERIRVDGQPVEDETLCAAFERIETARGEIPLTYFEFGTLAALDLVARIRPDLAILEVGLGGRLDAVNLIDADVSVVTSIGLDHTAWLGDTLEAIAIEKAGIFRAGRPAIIGQRDAPDALRSTALTLGAAPRQLGREFDLEPTDAGWRWSGSDAAGSARHLALPLPTLRGPFQLDNAAAAIAALDALGARLPLPVNAIRAGLQRAWLPGRFQVIAGTPTWILDVAHNGAAATALAANLRAFAGRGKLRAVLAVLADKDPEAIVAPLLPFVTHWYLASGTDARAMPLDELVRRVGDAIPESARAACPDLDAALTAGVAASGPDDSLLILGSFTTVAHALRRAGRHAE